MNPAVTVTCISYSPVSIFSTSPDDLRYSTDLCREEKRFLLKRKDFVFESMRSLLGERGPQTIEEVSETEYGTDDMMYNICELPSVILRWFSATIQQLTRNSNEEILTFYLCDL